MSNIEQGLNISVPKTGRLSQPSQELLRESCFSFTGSNHGDRLTSPVGNFPMIIFFDRDGDIPVGVEAGDSDLGIVGRNTVIESRTQVLEIIALGFGKCRLVVAAPTSISTLDQLRNKRVITSHPNSAADFFNSEEIPVILTTRLGSIEGYPQRGYDAIVDITESGKTLTDYRLRVVEEIYPSEAVLIASPLLKEKPGTQTLVQQFLWRVSSALRARDFRYVLLNVPQSAADDIIKALPSSESPTISELKKAGWLAIASVVPVSQIFEVGTTLQGYGAKDIVIQPMDNMLPNPDDRGIMEMMKKIYG